MNEKPTRLRAIEPDAKLTDDQRHAVERLRREIERFASGKAIALVGVIITEDEDGDEHFERIELGSYVQGGSVATALRIQAREAEEDFDEMDFINPEAE